VSDGLFKIDFVVAVAIWLHSIEAASLLTVRSRRAPPRPSVVPITRWGISGIIYCKWEKEIGGGISRRIERALEGEFSIGEMERRKGKANEWLWIWRIDNQFGGLRRGGFENERH
jgi:hypothetical protein